jgi:FAD/FMN-containing dehydrogenase
LCSTGGPGIDWWRLLTGCQGTFGVITIMNVKIFHKPLKQKVVFLPFDKLEDAVMPLYTIQKREIGHECFLLNSYDIAAIMAEKDSEIPDLAQKLPNYCIVLNLWGGQFFPEERIAYEEKAVAEIANEYKCSSCEALASFSDANSRFENMLTSPWESDVYWKDRQMGGCLEVVFESGLDKVPSYWRLFQEMAGEYNIDIRHLGLYIQPRQRARVCHVEFHIPCDPGNVSKIENVKTFHKKVSEAVMNAGAFFYRPYYDWANIIYSRSGYAFETIKKLKKILDPHRVLNPGKLNL